MPKLRNALIKARDQVHIARDRISASRAAPSVRDALGDVHTYCMFVGYPRSAHTLVGSLLNAHPEMVISHELNALRYVRAGFGRTQLFAMILKQDAKFTAAGSRWSGYDYSVPGQWQGRYSTLRVIGDKKAAGSSILIREDPGILDRLQELVGVRVRIIHVVRNPFDNIATMLRYGGKGLERATDAYFRLCEGPVLAERRSRPGQFITIRHENFIADPARTLSGLCGFLGIEAPPDYLEAAAGKVMPSPRRTRREAPWTSAAIEEVQKRMAGFDFFAGYHFDEESNVRVS